MKILFLDIDGVLNSDRSFIGGAHRAKEWDNAEDPYYKKITKATIDPVACDLVNRVIKACDVKIVLSSTHRIHFRDSPQKLQQIREYLNFLGVNGDACIGFTERLNSIRGTEIALWLNSNPGATHYVILDDSCDMLPEQMPYFVRCDASIGVSSKNYREMTTLFGMEDSGLILF